MALIRKLLHSTRAKAIQKTSSRKRLETSVTLLSTLTQRTGEPKASERAATLRKSVGKWTDSRRSTRKRTIGLQRDFLHRRELVRQIPTITTTHSTRMSMRKKNSTERKM